MVFSLPIRGTLIRALVALAACFVIVRSSSAATVVVTASKDATLYEDATGALSDGGGDYLSAGFTGELLRHRLLVAFDLASVIPENAVITSAVLTLYLSRTAAGSPTSNASLFRVMADWGEGTTKAPSPEGHGAQAAAGDATWLYRFFGDDSKKWAAAGGDFAAQASATTSVGTVGSNAPPVPYTWTSAGLLSDVQSWHKNPSTNFGWELLANEVTSASAKRFDSRNSVATGPKLTVQYEIVPEPSIIGMVAVSGLLLGFRRIPARLRRH